MTPLRSIDSKRLFSTTGLTPGGGGANSLTSRVLPSPTFKVCANDLLDDAVFVAVSRVAEVNDPTQSGVVSGVVEHNRARSAVRREIGEEDRAVFIDDVSSVLNGPNSKIRRSEALRRCRAVTRDEPSEAPQHHGDQPEDDDAADIGQ